MRRIYFIWRDDFNDEHITYIYYYNNIFINLVVLLLLIQLILWNNLYNIIINLKVIEKAKYAYTYTLI